MEFILFLIVIGFSIITLVAAYIIGTIIEKNHYESIKQRERIYLNLPTLNTKKIDIDPSQISDSKLVYGNAVISIDKFKRFLAGLINIFGGNVIAYESVLDRARREAVLRMKEMATNSDMIINTRIETSTIGKTFNSKENNSGLGCVEILAYGTAIKLK